MKKEILLMSALAFSGCKKTPEKKPYDSERVEGREKVENTEQEFRKRMKDFWERQKELPPGTKISSSEVRQWREYWEWRGVHITSSGVENNDDILVEDGLTNYPNRTYMPGMRVNTMKGFLALVKGAKAQEVYVNGLAEGGSHKAGKKANSLSHGNGFKVDFLTQRAGGRRLAKFIQEQDREPRRCSYGLIYEFSYNDFEFKIIMGGQGHGTHADVAVKEPMENPSTPSVETFSTKHVVKKGDMLFKIAERHGITLQELLDSNKELKGNPNRIQIGQRINLPERGKR